MAQDIPTLETTARDKTGSRYSARLREAGQIPAVVYGHKQDPVHVAVDAQVITGLLHENTQLVNAQVAGKTEPCLIKDIQWDYLGDHIIHVDLARVDLSEEVEVEVELELTGDPKSLQEAGAVLDHPLSTVTVKCRADAIPERLIHDISELTTDAPITVADLTLPAGVVAVTDPETIIAQVQIMAEIEEEEAVEAEAAEGEPEVIGAKKEDEAE